MVKLKLPEYAVNTRLQGTQQFIFDQIRKKYVILTPEEWVRQHFLNYLINHLGYPKSLIKVESGLSVNKMDKRTDILVYNKDVKPFLLVECKAAHVELDNKVFDQLSVYNCILKAPYLVITNGIKHYCCNINYQTSSYQFQSGIPLYD